MAQKLSIIQNNMLPPLYILSGGLGTRLKTVLEGIPKPMAEISGKPFLELLISYYQNMGVSEFILCNGYLSDVIEDYFQGKSNISIVTEKKPLGTAGAIFNAWQSRKDPEFIVCNGDSFCDVNLNDFIYFVKKNDIEFAVVVSQIEDASDYGTVLLDESFKITSFLEKDKNNTNRALINAGIYYMTSKNMPYLENKFSIEKEVFPLVAKENLLYAYQVSSDIIDIGTPDRLVYAKKYFNST